MLNLNQTAKDQNDMVKKQMEANPDYIFGTIMDDESKVQVNKITAQDPVQFMFITLMYILNSYSDHKKLYPTFNNFTVNIERDENKSLKGIKINLNEKTNDKEYNFSVIFDKLPDKYIHYNGNMYIDDEIIYDIDYNPETTESKCTMMSMRIPYSAVDFNNQIIKDFNKNNYSDIHDTIFAFNICIPKIIRVKAKCNEKDTPSYEMAHEICRKKALFIKIGHDISDKKKYTRALEYAISDTFKDINKFNKSIKNSEKAKHRLLKAIKKLNEE